MTMIYNKIKAIHVKLKGNMHDPKVDIKATLNLLLDLQREVVGLSRLIPCGFAEFERI